MRANRKELPLELILGLSLVLHGTALMLYERYAIYQATGNWRQALAGHEPKWLFDGHWPHPAKPSPNHPHPAPIEQSVPELLPIEPVAALPPPAPDPWDQLFGERGGTGDAMNSMPGDHPMRAIASDETQAFLGKNAYGPDPNSNAPGDKSSSAQPANASSPQPPLHPQQHANGSTPPSPALLAELDPSAAAPPAPFGSDMPPSRAPIHPATKSPPPITQSPIGLTPTPPPPPQGIANGNPDIHLPTSVPTDKPPQTLALATQYGPHSPGEPAAHSPLNPSHDAPPSNPSPPSNAAPIAGLNPGSTSDSESDAFAHDLYFEDGAVHARNGRQVRSVRPRLSDAGYFDLLAMQRREVDVAATIDESGKVIDVRIIRSSGSDNVDQPVYRAMWQWWIEPTRDAAGKPKKDIVTIPFIWH